MRALVAVVALAACGGKAAAPCDDLRPMVDRLYALAMKDLGAVSPRERKLAVAATQAAAPPLKDAIVRACRDDRWSAAVVACMAAATDESTLDDCEGRLDAAQRAHIEQAMSEVVTNIPAPPVEDGDVEDDDLGTGESGLPECDDYGKALAAYFDCDAVPEAVKRSAHDELAGLRRTWSVLRDPSTAASARKAAADACAKARAEVETSAKALGCGAPR